MGDYLAWNDALASRFFNHSMRERPVTLYTTPEVITETARRIGKEHDNFLEAVVEGPSWTTRSGFCQKALQTHTEWRSREGIASSTGRCII